MKLFFVPFLLFCLTTGHCQFATDSTVVLPDAVTFNHFFITKKIDENPVAAKIEIEKSNRWRINKNRIITGGLLVLSGAAKGFNETLQFNWQGFESVFPKANPQWFWPQKSFNNKYKDGDPEKGEKFPLSSSVLVMFTDQYHLNNFIQRGAITAALVIKIGEGKKPFRHYVFDALYYTACYQAGFGSVYYTFKSRMK